MIFNMCIQGSVIDSNGDIITDSKVLCKYVNHDMTMIIENEYQNTDGIYQFNLGNIDSLGVNGKIEDGDVVLLSNIVNDVIVCTNIIYLNNDTMMYNVDLISDDDFEENDDEAKAQNEDNNVIAYCIIREELSDNLYTYFNVSYNDEIVYESNKRQMIFIPKNIGDHTVVQRSINITTGEISEKIETIDIKQSEYITKEINYVFYAKKKKIVRCDLPQFVKDTLILDVGWKWMGDTLIGSTTKLGETKMKYFNGSVIIKGMIGDIIDY